MMPAMRTLSAVLLLAALLGSSEFVGTTPSAQTALPLLQQADLRYEGAFRLPEPTGEGEKNTFGYGGTALAFDPARGSLWLTGHDWHQRIAEVSVPTPSPGSAAMIFDRRWASSPPGHSNDRMKPHRGAVAPGCALATRVAGPLPE